MTVQLAIDERREAGATTWGELAPAAVMPAQLAAAFRLDASVLPEKRLMLAVVEEAVAAYQQYVCAGTTHGRREFLEAQSWIEFCNICETLGVEADAVRRGLRLWRERQLALPASQRVRIRHPFRRTNGSRTRTTGRAPGIRLVD